MLHAQGLPDALSAVLRQANIPASAVGIAVLPADGKTAPVLAHNKEQALNPASVMKVVTSYAALDILGPAYVWKTPVYIDGKIDSGVLDGNVYIKGAGNPKLVVENIWLLLRRLQGLGIQEIRGDFVIDNTAFQIPQQDPGEFDDAAERPYNVLPEALLLNYKSLIAYITPVPGKSYASVHIEPPLYGVSVQNTIPLNNKSCGTDWKQGLQANTANMRNISFAGSYPRACGEGAWAVAFDEPQTFSSRVLRQMWAQLGGRFSGTVRPGNAPEAASQVFTQISPSLSEILRDQNKFSNNMMARHVFLSLSLKRQGTGTLSGSRQILQDWWTEKLPNTTPPVVDNGSGLSLGERISPIALASMLQHAWQSPLMPELLSSLPIAGVDGTMRRSKASEGKSHIKTGTMPKSGVSAIAGYVHATSGQRYVVAAIINHANAAQARPFFDALLDWVVEK